jgi:hypothetical protein
MTRKSKKKDVDLVNKCNKLREWKPEVYCDYVDVVYLPIMVKVQRKEENVVVAAGQHRALCHWLRSSSTIDSQLNHYGHAN